MKRPPRVALFTDCFHEVNGAAHTCRQLVQYASQSGLPFLSVHSGPSTQLLPEGSILKLELQRGGATIPVDVDFGCDLLLWRYAEKVERVLSEFQPDVIHVICPGDFGGLGAYLGHRLGIPIIGSYHTELHQFAAARLNRSLSALSSAQREPVVNFARQATLEAMTLFYRIPRVLLAPTPEICSWLGRATGRPCHLMGRGVDTASFSPEWRTVNDGVFRLGYVGRLTSEKNVRFLAEIERAILARGMSNYRFVVVGEGSERNWLIENLRRADVPGVLRGEELSRAYANLDLFVFPSHADSFGNVVQEALASGVPAIVTADGGPKFVIEDGVTGFAAATKERFIDRVLELMGNPGLRQRMARAAHEAIRSRTWEDVMSGVYERYAELCEGRASQPPVRAKDFPPPRLNALGMRAPVTKQ